MALVRVSKFLSNLGIASRRSIEKLIDAGKVSINGQVIREQGIKIDPDKDRVMIENKIVKNDSLLVYFWINKPVGIISAASSRSGETTVVDLVGTTRRIFPVGRLDKDSQGLLLLTNDGELTHRLTHPKYHIDKTYHVSVRGTVTDKKLDKLRQGVQLSEGRTAPAEISRLDKDMGTDYTWLSFVIHEGKNRQIRRMCEKVNLTVVDLIRVAVGPIHLTGLKPGNWRYASQQEIQSLKELVGMHRSLKVS